MEEVSNDAEIKVKHIVLIGCDEPENAGVSRFSVYHKFSIDQTQEALTYILWNPNIDLIISRIYHSQEAKFNEIKGIYNAIKDKDIHIPVCFVSYDLWSRRPQIEKELGLRKWIDEIKTGKIEELLFALLLNDPWEIRRTKVPGFWEKASSLKK